MTKIVERYASAVRSSNLKSKPDTHMSDADVLGAAAYAGRPAGEREDGSRRASTPLGMSLLRLFMGDEHAARDLVVLMGGMLVGKAWHGDRVELPRAEAEDIARSVLAWHRDGVCTTCYGRGYGVIEGSRTLNDIPCPTCRGSAKLPFDVHFTLERLGLARWLVGEIEREQGVAGTAAMRALAPRLDV